MALLAIFVGVLLLGIVLWDTVETVVLPRTVTNRIRLTRLFYLFLRRFWLASIKISSSERREAVRGAYGPLSMLLLLTVWALCQVLSFALIQWGYSAWFLPPKSRLDFGTSLYLSGVTFFTLGYGDVTVHSAFGRTFAVVEAGVGFGFLAVVLSYLPVLYQSFSRRELGISLLDARAGSPPCAAELLSRHAESGNMPELIDLLREFERWASDLLESHLSFPVLMFYRSQHDRQSWLSALTTILDTCTLIRVGFAEEHEWERRLAWQAQMTFAMARHALVDLALIVFVTPTPPEVDRLSAEDFILICDMMRQANIPLCEDEGRYEANRVRQQYEAYVNALAGSLLVEIPPWVVKSVTPDNWQRSYWESLRHL